MRRIHARTAISIFRFRVFHLPTTFDPLDDQMTKNIVHNEFSTHMGLSRNVWFDS